MERDVGEGGRGAEGRGRESKVLSMRKKKKRNRKGKITKPTRKWVDTKIRHT